MGASDAGTPQPQPVAKLVLDSWYRSEKPVEGRVIEKYFAVKYNELVQFCEGLLVRKKKGTDIFILFVNPLPNGPRVFVEVPAERLRAVRWFAIEAPLGERHAAQPKR